MSASISVVSLETVPDPRLGSLTDRLDRGEAEAFAVAEEHGGLLVTDDGAARDLARERDVRFTGSIGVLIELVEEGEVDESTADTWLKRWIDGTNYRAPASELSQHR